MVTDVETLLNEVSSSEGPPSLKRKARIYLKYTEESSESHWGPYPRMSFQPRFQSPDVPSELIVYRGDPSPLLRLAPALEETMRKRPERYRVLVVPSELKHVSTMFSGVSDTVVIPPQRSVSSWLEFMEDEFDKQSFQRIINCSSGPAGAWLAELTRRIVDVDRAEGVFFNGLTPVLKAGPGVLLYHNWLLQNRETNSPPVRHGAFEGLMFGDNDHNPNSGLSVSENARKAAEDFRQGLQFPNRPLTILVPPWEGTDREARHWGGWANELMKRENKDVVLFGKRSKHEFHKSIERELKGTITFADRWLPNAEQKTALIGLAEGVVTGRKLEMLLSVREETPVVFLNNTTVSDVMNRGNVMIRRDDELPDAKELVGVYLNVVSNHIDPESIPEIPGEYEIEPDNGYPALIRHTTKHPRRPIEHDDFKTFLLKLCEYRVWFVVNDFVDLELPDLNKQRILSALRANYGERRFGQQAKDVIDEMRDELNSLEQKLASEVTGVDLAQPPSLTEEEERWFTILNPLWTFRRVADGEEKSGKILWGFRYFFSKCKKILQFVENS